VTPSPLLISIGSALATAALLLATPGHAASGAGYYAARPVTATAPSRLVARELIWQCNEAGCIASAKSNSRPAIICQSLVKEVGALASFRAGAEVFDADALAKCNAKA